MMRELLSKSRSAGDTRLLRSFALHYSGLIGPSIPELDIARSMVTRLLDGKCTIADLVLFRERMLHRPERFLSLSEAERPMFEAAYCLASPSSWEAALAIHDISFQLIDIRASVEEFQEQQDALHALCDDMRFFVVTGSLGEPEKLLLPGLPISDLEARELARRYLRLHERTDVKADDVIKLVKIGSFYNFGNFDVELCWAVCLDDIDQTTLRSSRFLVVDAIDGKILGTVQQDGD